MMPDLDRYQYELINAICDAWNRVAYDDSLPRQANWPLPDGIERIELRRGEVWIRRPDGTEEFIRTM